MRLTDRANIDDASAFADMLDGGLRGQQQAEDVDVELPVEMVFGDGFDGAEFIDAGVVDQDIESAEVLDGGGDDALASAALETSPPTATALPPLVMAATTASAPALLEA